MKILKLILFLFLLSTQLIYAKKPLEHQKNEIITPPNIKVELLNDDGNSYEGKIVKLKTTKFFIPTYWEVKIEKLQKPNILIDIAIKSPFQYWKHQHIFNMKNDQSELVDIIDYELPFGLLGKIIEPLITKDIKQMFEYRHIKTKEILEKNHGL